MHELTLRGDYIELDKLLKALGLVESGGRARVLIAAGEVKVDGQVELRKTAKIRAGQDRDFRDGPRSGSSRGQPAVEGADTGERLSPPLKWTVMRRLAFALLFAACHAVAAPGETLIHAGRLIDTEAGRLLERQSIVVFGDKISAVKPGYTDPAGYDRRH